MIKNNSMCFNITSKFSEPQNSSGVFSSMLESSLHYLKSVSLSNPELFKVPSNSLDFTHPTASTLIRSSNDLKKLLEQNEKK